MFLSNFLFNCHPHLISLECDVLADSPSLCGLGRAHNERLQVYIPLQSTH